MSSISSSRRGPPRPSANTGVDRSEAGFKLQQAVTGNVQVKAEVRIALKAAEKNAKKLRGEDREALEAAVAWLKPLAKDGTVKTLSPDQAAQHRHALKGIKKYLVDRRVRADGLEDVLAYLRVVAGRAGATEGSASASGEPGPSSSTRPGGRSSDTDKTDARAALMRRLAKSEDKKLIKTAGMALRGMRRLPQLADDKEAIEAAFQWVNDIWKTGDVLDLSDEEARSHARCLRMARHAMKKKNYPVGGVDMLLDYLAPPPDYEDEADPPPYESRRR